MKHILIIDPTTPKPYTHETCLTEPLGGTEATVGRVGLSLSQYFNITHVQRGRTDMPVYSDTLRYLPIDSEVKNPDIVITLRDAIVYRNMRLKYPDAKHFFWLHDCVTGNYAKHMHYNLDGLEDIRIITVSQWHARHVRQAIHHTIKLDIKTIYPPLATYCTRTTKQYDPYKLVFFSSPHKGLDYVLTIFKTLRDLDSRFYMHIANPGYYPNAEISLEGVKNLGALSHTQVIDEVSTALCTFYPQVMFEETFGLVMAESMAIGTPVIVHPIGAVMEVVDHPNCIVNCMDQEKVINKVLEWSKGDRPTVSYVPYFKLDTVIQQWKRLFNNC